MTEIRTVESANAPRAIGPYSQAIAHGTVLYCSGQLPLDPSTGELVKLDLGDQTRRCLENLEAVCQAACTSLRRALRLTVYTTELARFGEINEAYEGFFAELGGHAPARAAVGVAALPRGAAIEIDAIVALA